MNWEQTSVTKEEYYNMLSTIQIKNDCETLNTLKPMISQPVIILGMLPYLSLFCSSFQEYINRYITPLNIKNDSPFAISDMRNKLKLFDERYGKSQKQILLSNDLQDEEYKGRLLFPWTRGLNIHYNLGIFCDKDGHIIGNTQYTYYIFQDKSFSKSLQNPKDVSAFGQAIGTVINSACLGLKDFLPDYSININNRKFKIMYKDFNTNNKFSLFTHIKNGKEVTLRLLHMLTFINFLRFVVIKVTDYTNSWSLRAIYITLYYVVKSIEKLANVLDTDNEEALKLSTTLKDSISFEDKLFNYEFRSCMMHYGFYNNGKWAIDDRYLDVQTPLFGLIESRFGGCSYIEYFDSLVDKVVKISDTLTTLLPINLTGLKVLEDA